MKILFFQARSKAPLNEKRILDISSSLPKKISIAYSIQFKNHAYRIKEILSKNHEIKSIIQVLGCSNPVFPKDTQAILLVGSGKFHAISLAFESKLPTFVLSRDNLERVSKEEVEKLERKHKAAILKFHNSKKVGVLISTKPGQEKLKAALKLREKYKDKEFYMFINNDINIKEFENFGLNIWVNTACPRLDYDYPIINVSELIDKRDLVN